MLIKNKYIYIYNINKKITELIKINKYVFNMLLLLNLIFPSPES